MDINSSIANDSFESGRHAEAAASRQDGMGTDQESDFESCQEFRGPSDDRKSDATGQSSVEERVEDGERDCDKEDVDYIANGPLSDGMADEKTSGNSSGPLVVGQPESSTPSEDSASEDYSVTSRSLALPPDIERPVGGRQKRNSLALRKNIPSRFSTGMANSSANNSDIYDLGLSDANNVMDDSTSTHPSSLEKAKTPKRRAIRRKKKQKRGLLRSTCLNPFFSLRTQMMLSFGFFGVSIICFVMLVCIVVTILSGQEVNRITSEAFDSISVDIDGRTVRYIAEFLTYRLIPKDLVQILWETTRDRMAGYPDAVGYEEDAHVPFFDIESGTNRYPVVGPALPFDWQLSDPLYQNVNNDNYREHVQNRADWYRIDSDLAERYGINQIDVSTAAGFYFMQGSCNPNITDPSHPAYYPGCSAANNDLVTGGVVAPTINNQWLHRKSADLIPVLKALYEYHLDVKSLGFAFANGGAGSRLEFPLYTINSKATYISQGCDWMLEANPYDPSRSIGTPEMIGRCHPAGTEVVQREYNPLERSWCQNQALEPEKVHIEGPFVDTGSLYDARKMTVGRALYDRVTKGFIGCIRVNLVVDFLDDVLSKACASKNSHVTLVRLDDTGTVVASSKRTMSNETEALTIEQLNLGLDEIDYLEWKNLIDYESPWNANEVRRTYEAFVTSKDGYLIGAYPIPPPPESYDPNYTPLFLVVNSLLKKEIFDELYVAQDAVDGQVQDLVNLSLFIGLIGIVIILSIIGCVSSKLTAPLNFMNEVATDIVNNYVDNREEGIAYDVTKYASWLTPKTEISELVAEFQKLVGRFSGTSNAKSMKGRYAEMRNDFSHSSSVLDDLYSSRQDKSFPYRLEEEPCSPHERENGAVDLINLGVQQSTSSRRHSGRVIRVREPMKRSASERNSDLRFARERKWFLSPLFSWIVLLIATPLLLTMILMSADVTYRVSTEFPELVEGAKTDYLALELFAVQLYVGLRADFIAALTTRSTRDLHLLSRYSSWLLFNGVERADSFTELVSGVEECKVYDDLSVCPFVEKWSCDCAWNDESKVCHNYTADSRYLQKVSFVSESSDADADGDRNSSSFPKIAFSPETTSWWEDASRVPGFERGRNASGYETTYDRLRVLSAMPVFQPLWNYGLSERHVEGSGVAMEDDGTFLSYNGCNSLAHASHWSSSPENGGPSMRPEICPDGKFGYDPRCRSWYHTGRTLFLESETSFYLTSTYKYGNQEYAQSATSPIVDPSSNKHVGQTVVDFNSRTIFETLNAGNTPIRDNNGYRLLITPRPPSFGGDTVIGPGFDSNGPAPSIETLVFGHEAIDCPDLDCPGIKEFNTAILEMKAGGRGSSQFSKKGNNGIEQTMHIAYAPVRVNALVAKNSSDFTRGVCDENHLIYSLGFVISIEGILKPFAAIEEAIDRQAKIAISVLCVAIVVAACLLVYISGNMAASIAKPMVYLVNRIRLINCLSVDDISSSACPEVDKDYGCREVRHVSSTMEVLYRVVRDANVAFFAGDVETAYAVLTDTLRLFIRLNNKKAIGVSNNNLGNTMLTIYRRMQSTGEEKVCGYTKKEVVEKGIAYFHKAIKLGETAYDEFYEAEGWSPNCLDFMQHLANRYFNRALFLLTVKDSHQNPAELEELGFRDLQIVRDMDIEIVDEGTQVGWNVRTADQLFEVKLSRIKGLIQLLEMGYADEWDLEEHLDDACRIVKEELKKDSSKLFEELSPAGRMQQVETELMRFLMIKGEVEAAGKIAIRMLVEDEYTLPISQVKAVEVILELLTTCDDTSLQQEVKSFQVWVNAMADENNLMLSSSAGPDTSDMSEVFQLSTARLSTASTLTDDRRSRKSTLRESSRGDFTMEIF